ncbi:MAG: pyrrolo-quinoline quinone, partial [Gammaproteobacteria bacterium]
MMKLNKFKRTLVSTAGAALLVTAAVAAAPVDDDRLANAAADPQNWLSFGQNYTNQRFSALSQINRNNVTRLAPRWTFRSGAKGPFQAQPLVADGVMYVTLPGNDVVALDAASGVERWRYRH